MKFQNVHLALLFSASIAACSNNINIDDEVAASREASKQLGAQLKSKLVSVMQSDGPEAAITVCNIDAMPITAEVSKINKLEIGRTSLKLRNANNQPDDWETKQLHWFASEADAGVDLKTLETYEIVKQNGKKVFRYMKAIPMQEPCLLCHGATLAPQIEAKIKSLYPQDQATGFEVGHVRGAFTVKKVL